MIIPHCRNNRSFEISEHSMPNLKLFFFRALLDWLTALRNLSFFSIVDLLDLCNFWNWLFHPSIFPIYLGDSFFWHIYIYIYSYYLYIKKKKKTINWTNLGDSFFIFNFFFYLSKKKKKRTNLVHQHSKSSQFHPWISFYRKCKDFKIKSIRTINSIKI